MPFTARRADQIEKVIIHSGDCEFRTDGAFVSEPMSQHRGTDPAWHAIGQNVIEPGLGTGPLNLILAHRCHFKQTNRFTHCPAFGPYMRHRVEYSVTPLVAGFYTLWCKPQGYLPAVYRTPDGTGFGQAVVAGHGFGGTGGRPFIARVMHAEIMTEGLFVLDPGIDLIGVVTEPSGIDFGQVDMGFAIDDPVDEFMAQTTAHKDAACESFSEP